MRKFHHWFYLPLLSLTLIACHAGRNKQQLTKPILQSEYTPQNKEEQPTEEPEITKKEEPNLPPKEITYSGSLQDFLPSSPADASAVQLVKAGYTVSYNVETKNPNWVAWHLTADHTEGSYKRKGIDFRPDEDAPAPQVDTYDYMQSGFDRGHMCPAADNKWSQEAMEDCFLMTNMCPQIHALNSGLWNTLENQCRSWAKKYGDIYIVSGPIFLNTNHKKIGKHKVWVPEAFFKVILCMRGEPKAIGFVCRNRSEKGHKKNEFVNSIDQIERITGIDFFPSLPDDIEQKVEATADYEQW